jgi:hypothetical protein
LRLIFCEASMRDLCTFNSYVGAVATSGDVGADDVCVGVPLPNDCVPSEADAVECAIDPSWVIPSYLWEMDAWETGSGGNIYCSTGVATGVKAASRGNDHG